MTHSDLSPTAITDSSCHIAIREKEFFTGECKMKEVKVTAIEHASVYLILLYYLEKQSFPNIAIVEILVRL